MRNAFDHRPMRRRMMASAISLVFVGIIGVAFAADVEFNTPSGGNFVVKDSTDMNTLLEVQGGGQVSIPSLQSAPIGATGVCFGAGGALGPCASIVGPIGPTGAQAPSGLIDRYSLVNRTCNTNQLCECPSVGQIVISHTVVCPTPVAVFLWLRTSSLNHINTVQATSATGQLHVTTSRLYHEFSSGVLTANGLEPPTYITINCY